VALALFAMGVAAYVFFTGPHDLSRYPDRERSPYKLPWPAGVTRLCGQSNRGIVSHRGWENYAYDFSMPVGSEVCAARSGWVSQIDVSHDGHGLRAPNNFIRVVHTDLTKGSYLHLQKGGSLVRPGQWVEQGQVIARSGHVGRSLAPHLHFHVVGARTIPVTFADVPKHFGIPRMGFFYTSGNTPPSPKKSDPTADTTQIKTAPPP